MNDVACQPKSYKKRYIPLLKQMGFTGFFCKLLLQIPNLVIQGLYAERLAELATVRH